MKKADSKQGRMRVVLFFVAAAVAAVALAAALASITAALRGGGPRDVPVLFGDMPAFALQSQHGEPITRDDLRGKVWVASFVFTRCAGTCPMITSRKAELQQLRRQMIEQHEMWRDVRLVSFSVDPGHDTPEVLRGYADRYEADGEHWFFLTGDREVIWALIRDGFRLSVEDAPDNPQMPILHSEQFVLVDREGQVRGYYDAFDEEQLRSLYYDMWAVLEQQPAGG